MSAQRFFVCGTDTGIGKTMVSLLLMRALFTRKEKPFYYKWLQTGCTGPYDDDSDARFVYSRTPELARHDPAQSVGWCFRNPKAPYQAALDDGVTLTKAGLMDALKTVCAAHPTVVSEAAGGLMVPALADASILDLMAAAAEAFGFVPLLAARDSLGTINHALLSIAMLKDRGIPPAGVVLVATPEGADPTLVQENRETIEHLSGIPVLGVVPRISDAYNPPAEALEPFLTLLASRA